MFIWTLFLTWLLFITTKIGFPFMCVIWYIMLRFVWLALWTRGREHALARMTEIYTVFHHKGVYTEDWRIIIRLDLSIAFLYYFFAYFGPVIFLGYKIAAGARDFMNPRR